MVKEEDKGRGCVTVHWRDVFFSSQFFLLDFPEIPQLSQGKAKKKNTEKNPPL
jgi:hypothetical protein